MLEHIPRLPRARPTRLPAVVFLLLLAVPVGLSVLHGYDSKRQDHTVRLHSDLDLNAQLARSRVLFSAGELPETPPPTHGQAPQDKRDDTPFAIVRRWLNLPG